MHFFQLTGGCIYRTYLRADQTTDTIIFYKSLRPLGYEVCNCFCRTFAHTEAAYPALIKIYLRKVIFYGRGIKRADLYAGAACDTAHLAVLPRFRTLVL